MKIFGDKSKDSENSPMRYVVPFTALGIVLLMVAAKSPEVIALPVIALLISPFWLWIRNRHELQKAKIKALNSEDPAKDSRVEERIANLEALICRMDTELNQQMERSLMSTRWFSAPNMAGSSKTPTSLINLAAALEGRYQVLSELGRGGMGIVYQAYDKQLKEQVAIKLLSPLLSTDPEALERLTREVSMARRVTHPNVIRIHDLSEVNGLHYVSMEYFGGVNLKDHLKRSGPLSLLNAYQIFSQICDGLEAAHSQGVIHRDLKAQNIMIGQSGQVKIIDFGLARSVHMEGMTATGLIMGTPEYMAPEQVSGKPVDERADIYALGVILYEMLTGRVPFTGDSPIAVGFQQLKDPPPPPRSLNQQIPEEVERIILKALEKEPIRRYRNADEMRRELAAALPGFALTSPASQPTTDRSVAQEKN
ncbi:MAG TPA: serine/threonine-protein kinase [Acidobacteriota bacterium]|nr:serine/threonine-protein kinase [Acidobacteriota bacterium]